MGNIITTIKRFLSNKNTVTILGVLLGVVVLYVFYNYRVSQAVDTVMIPYATQEITATSEISSDYISTTEVLRSFVSSHSNLVTDATALINTTNPQCITYGTSVPSGAFFYTEQVVTCASLPNNPIQDIPDGYTVFSMSVDIHSTYGNSMYPGDYIDLYVMMKSSTGSIIFGKLIESIEIQDVRDNQGKSVFLTSEGGTPAELLFAVPDDLFWLLNVATEINGLELVPVPRNASYTSEPGTTSVSSEYLRQEIESYAVQIPDATTSSTSSSSITNTTTTTKEEDDNSGEAITE